MRAHWLLPLAAFIVIAPGVAAQAPVSEAGYEQIVTINRNGSAHTSVSVPILSARASIAIPVVGGEPLNIAVTTDTGNTAEATWNAERQQISLDTAALQAASAAVRVTYDQERVADVAGSSLTLHQTFVNTTDAPFERCTLEFVLPEGFVFGSVTSRDAQDKTGTATLDSRAGRHLVRLSGTAAPRGGRLSVDFTASERQVSPLLPLTLVVVSLAYLVGFRDLARRRP